MKKKNSCATSNRGIKELYVLVLDRKTLFWVHCWIQLEIKVLETCQLAIL